MNVYARLLVLAIIFLEWLDFSLYLYLAKAVFAHEFFPNSANSLLLTFAIFAAAYLARPIGAWVFGRAADLYGRRKPLLISAALMGVATLGICFLPNYASIGMTAAWGLLLLRVTQGLALGGEMNTSAMYLIEHQAQSPLVAGSLVAICSALGMFTGGALSAIIQSLNIGGLWRIVFAFAGILSMWVCRKRRQLSESPEYEKQTDNELKAWSWPGVVNIAVIALFVSVTVYICNILWLSFVVSVKMWSPVTCAWLASLAQCASALLAYPIARYNHPNKSHILLQVSMVIIACDAPLLFYSTAHDLQTAVVLSLCLYVLGNAFLCSALFYFLYQQLPTHYRCRGVSTVWALAASLGAASLPICQKAVSMGAYWVPSMIVSITALIALLVVYCNKLQTYPHLKKILTRSDLVENHVSDTALRSG